MLTRPLYEVASNDVPSAIRVGVLLAWVALLLWGLHKATEHGLRGKLLEYLMRDGDYGWLSPLLLSVVVFFFAASGFAALTALLHDWDAVTVFDRTCPRCPLVFDDYLNFYTWHFLDAVPLLDVNETLRWEQPLVYQGALAAWLVLALKVAVILPIVALVRRYWKIRSKMPKVRVDAWPRIVHLRKQVKVKWASVPPPPGFVFDVYMKPPPGSDLSEEDAVPTLDTPEGRARLATALIAGDGWTVWKEGDRSASSTFDTPLQGRYLFQARWRRETESRADASKTPRTVTVTVAPSRATAAT